MSRNNDQVMTQYLSALLNEPSEEKVTLAQPAHAPSLEELLKRATPAIKELQAEPEKVQEKAQSTFAQNNEIKEKPEAKVEQSPTIAAPKVAPPKTETAAKQEAKQTVKQAPPEPKLEPKEITETEAAVTTRDNTLHAPSEAREQYMQGEFQALFFEVAGLVLAVPLKSLGGIHQEAQVTPIFGKPDWYRGVMLNRDEKISVVDTARWVMPEKYDEKMAESLNYNYVIMLGQSPWGLGAEKLINNLTLKPEDVKWRQSHGKRPWLAGVIKEKMCALIDVENLQLLLEKGLDSEAQ